MGYLTMTAVTTGTGNLPINKGLHNSNTNIRDTSYREPVIAEFKIEGKAYKYAISGISLSDVPSIPMLYPCLSIIFKRDTYAKIRDTDPNYALPRDFTFSAGTHTTEKITLASSFRALANLLGDVANRRVSGIQSLRIDDEAQSYKETKGTWRKSGWELVPLVFPKIQPFHFQALTALQVQITRRSVVVINGINDLFARGCFPNLKSLKLPIDGAGAYWHEEGWLSFNAHREQRALQNLLESGLMRANLPFLEELRLPILLSYGLPPALAFLRKVYPTLKKLEVDTMYPTAVYKGVKVEWELQHHEQYYMSGPYQDKWVNHSYTEEHYATELEVLKETVGPTLVSVLKEMKDQSQLESIEIQAEGVNGINLDQTDYRAIVELILSDALPNLKNLSMGPKSRYFGHYSDITTEVNDTTELLAAVIAKNVHLKLEHLGLTMPDQRGYQPWLDYMVEHGFPKMKSFHYMIPTKIKGEPREVHEQRLEKALQTILTAVRSGKLPALSSVVFQGLGDGVYAMLSESSVPPRLKSIISDIDNAVANQQQPGFVHHEYSASLSTSSASSSSEVSSEEEYAIRFASAESAVASPSHSPLSSSPEERLIIPLTQANPSALYSYYL